MEQMRADLKGDRRAALKVVMLVDWMGDKTAASTVVAMVG